MPSQSSSDDLRHALRDLERTLFNRLDKEETDSLLEKKCSVEDIHPTSDRSFLLCSIAVLISIPMALMSFVFRSAADDFIGSAHLSSESCSSWLSNYFTQSFLLLSLSSGCIAIHMISLVRIDRSLDQTSSDDTTEWPFPSKSILKKDAFIGCVLSLCYLLFCIFGSIYLLTTAFSWWFKDHACHREEVDLFRLFQFHSVVCLMVTIGLMNLCIALGMHQIDVYIQLNKHSKL